ncbi:hypothetical protein [Mycoplasma nasistruthionis]|uniref:Uncharacterized protein n=1 Tax=Mycoplasma nasistruthionis TaxID=353852 RepID=A0A4Y6I5V5_9MOLU|nr:hypothetical protein [Mycoplasma nasistruthionis]QDF64903.1 hypothetical protein FIV53_01075 [Mycoplasma nasistruthionis]
MKKAKLFIMGSGMLLLPLTTSFVMSAETSAQTSASSSLTKEGLKQHLQSKNFKYSYDVLGGLRNDQISALSAKIDQASSEESLSQIKEEIDNLYQLMTKWYNIFLSNSLGDPNWNSIEGLKATFGEKNISNLNNVTFYFGSQIEDKTKGDHFWDDLRPVVSNLFSTYFYPEATAEVSEEIFKAKFDEYKADFDNHLKEAHVHNKSWAPKELVGTGYSEASRVWGFNWDLTTTSKELDQKYNTHITGLGQWILTYLGTLGSPYYFYNGSNFGGEARMNDLKNGVNKYKDALRDFVDNFTNKPTDFDTNSSVVELVWNYQESDKYKNLDAENQKKVDALADNFKNYLSWGKTAINMNFPNHLWNTQAGGNSSGQGNNILNEILAIRHFEPLVTKTQELITKEAEIIKTARDKVLAKLDDASTNYPDLSQQEISELKAKLNEVKLVSKLGDFESNIVALNNLNKFKKEINSNLALSENIQETIAYKLATPQQQKAYEQALKELKSNLSSEDTTNLNTLYEAYLAAKASLSGQVVLDAKKQAVNELDHLSNKLKTLIKKQMDNSENLEQLIVILPFANNLSILVSSLTPNQLEVINNSENFNQLQTNSIKFEKEVALNKIQQYQGIIKSLKNQISQLQKDLNNISNESTNVAQTTDKMLRIRKIDELILLLQKVDSTFSEKQLPQQKEQYYLNIINSAVSNPDSLTDQQKQELLNITIENDETPTKSSFNAWWVSLSVIASILLFAGLALLILKFKKAK